MALEIPKQVAERLKAEQIIWLTTTKADGTPLPNPVWFHWNGEQFLVFTEDTSVKWKNIVKNSKVALNLNSSQDGGEVAIFQAEAKLNGAPPSNDELDSYVLKYKEGMANLGLTRDSMKTYALVRITPTKFRTYP